MAPDRGSPPPAGQPSEANHIHVDDEDLHLQSSRSVTREPIGREPNREFLARMSEQRQFTFRAVAVGTVIGVLIAFSNTYFGLQTGWISGMTMPSALIGFAYFKGLKTLANRLGEPLKSLGLGDGFSEVENVLVQTVAGSLGSMPLGCGFVGVIPALEFLLLPSETPTAPENATSSVVALTAPDAVGGLKLPLGKLILWALGLCFFGVVFAVPLRKEVIVREKLKFPSGTATALMIGVLHGAEKSGEKADNPRAYDGTGEESAALMNDTSGSVDENEPTLSQQTDNADNTDIKHAGQDWQKQIRLLTVSFFLSGGYTLLAYFIPQLHAIPFLGSHLANVWVWTFNPSPAYVGQGIIMGPATTIHMLLGALLGWAVLSPIAKFKGWAPGDVSDWNTGSKGWIVWVSLAIMLADAIVSLGWLILRPTIWYSRTYGPQVWDEVKRKGVKQYIRRITHPILRGYTPVDLSEPPEDNQANKANFRHLDDDEEYDAPPQHQIGIWTTVIGFILSLAFCLVAVKLTFQTIMTIGLTILALILALLLSVMGVRALGETDLNPVSGISKLTQLIFAVVTPPGNRNAVTINLIAGGISEAGALQAGDLLQDLKTGHLLGASPKAQFYGQLIGSAIGAVVSACIYKLYTHVYKIPGGLFQVPTGYVWVFTARLVTGQGLPPKTAEFAAAAGILWALLTALRIYGNSRKASWVPFVPGGIAVAVGMYNIPSFTLARTVGGLIALYWTTWKKKAETPVVVLASGLILGEGLISIVNLALASADVPHL